MIMPLADQPLG